MKALLFVPLLALAACDPAPDYEPTPTNSSVSNWTDDSGLCKDGVKGNRPGQPCK